MCRSSTQSRIMIPVIVAARRAVFGTRMPTPPAIRDKPVK
jgi:hypothetical protein